MDNILTFAQNLSDFKDRSLSRPVQGGNLLEFAHFSEPQISWAISEIFKYSANKSYPILQFFIDRYFARYNLKAECPSIMTEYSNIDICIIDNSYILIFENKIKGAQFQHNQMGRYIHWAETYHPGKTVLTVILSLNGFEGNTSTWRFPQKGFTSCNINNTECKCDYPQKYTREADCNHCIIYGKDRLVILQEDFTQWVIDATSIVPPAEHRLYSMMVQLYDYMNILFGNDNHSKQFNLEIRRFIMENVFQGKNGIDCLPELSEKIVQTKDLLNSLEDCYKSACESFITKCFEKMTIEYSKYYPSKSNEKYECGISVSFGNKSIWIFICIYDKQHIPGYGIWTNSADEEYIRQINDRIMDLNIASCVPWKKDEAGLLQLSTKENTYAGFKELADLFTDN